MKYLKIGIVIIFLLAIAGYFIFDLQKYINLEELKFQKEELRVSVAENYLLVAFLFCVGYIFATTFSIPVAAILTLAGGALFGLFEGAIYVSISSTIGATLSFLAARFVLHDFVKKNFERKLNKINKGIEREGSFYLFAIRLVPLFPFFAVNLVMALTSISIFKYIFASWLGMLPGTIAYVYAGTKLAEVNKMRDVLSMDIIIAFVIIGLLPIISKKIINYFSESNLAN